MNPGSNSATNNQTDLANKLNELKGTNHMIAHNLRGAGMNIKMLAEVLLSKNITDACDIDAHEDIFTTKEAVQYLHESSISLLNTLSTLLELTDIDLNEKIKYDVCDIAEIVKHVESQLSGFIHQKKAVLELDLEITHISYPQAYMESILYNFINNSLKYCRADVPLKIVIATHAENNVQKLSVKDNGLGIDLNVYRRRVFNLYQVFHSGYESKGIGLYIIKKQIESLGGKISVTSEVNEGCEFTVTF